MIRCIFLYMVLCMGGLVSLFPQSTPATADTTNKPLPAIQLQEYTIVGLSRITLPQKHRIELPLTIQTHWVNNPRLKQQPLPMRVFQFARKKPTITLPVNYPTFSIRAGYGSFQTVQGELSFQPRMGRLTPFVYLNYLNSRGHLEGAERQAFGFTTGANGQLWAGSRLESQLFFNTLKQGLWGTFYQQMGSHTIRRTRQGAALTLRQHFGEFFSLTTGGSYREFQHRNFRDTRQDMLAFTTRLAYQQPRFGLFVEGQWQQATTWQQNPFPGVQDTTYFRITHSLGNASLGLQFSLPMVDVTAGVRWQQWRPDSELTSISPVAPFFRVQFVPTRQWSIAAEYFSGVTIPSLEPLTREVLPTDVQNIRLVHYAARWQATITVFPTPHSRIDYRFQFTRQDQLPVIYSAASATDSLSPLWWIQFGTSGQTQSHTLEAQTTLARQFQLRTAVTFTRASIETQPTLQLPYVPQLRASATGKWRVSPRLAFWLSLTYTGTRYDDLANTQSLSPYWLLNLGGTIRFANRWELRLWGNNLLNQNYQWWREFTAPGIHFGATIGFHY